MVDIASEEGGVEEQADWGLAEDVDVVAGGSS